jgi:hypothetical protein
MLFFAMEFAKEAERSAAGASNASREKSGSQTVRRICFKSILD